MVLFCDSGGGHDENVIVRREGNKIEIVCGWREANKEAAAGRFIREWVQQKVKPEQVIVDAADKELWDLVERGGWPVRRQNFGQALPQNRRLHVVERDGLDGRRGRGQSGASGFCRSDDILFGEMTTRQKKLNVRGKWQAEEKVRDAQAQCAKSQPGGRRVWLHGRAGLRANDRSRARSVDRLAEAQRSKRSSVLSKIGAVQDGMMTSRTITSGRKSLK